MCKFDFISVTLDYKLLITNQCLCWYYDDDFIILSWTVKKYQIIEYQIILWKNKKENEQKKIELDLKRCSDSCECENDNFRLVTCACAYGFYRKSKDRRKNRKSNSRRDILTSVSLVTRHRWFHRDISVVIANLNYSLPISMSTTDDKICQALFIFHTFGNKKKSYFFDISMKNEWNIINEWNNIHLNFDLNFFLLFYYYFIIKYIVFIYKNPSFLNFFQNPIKFPAISIKMISAIF